MFLDLLLLVARGCGDHYGGHHRLARVRRLVDGTVPHRHHTLAHIPLRANQDNVQLQGYGGKDCSLATCPPLIRRLLHAIYCHICLRIDREDYLAQTCSEVGPPTQLLGNRQLEGNWNAKLFKLNSVGGGDDDGRFVGFSQSWDDTVWEE